MRSLLKKILLSWLTSLSRGIVKRYDPKVIAITGSFGKTSTKEAVFAVLNSELSEHVRASEGNLNTEWGLPFTIIGVKDPHGSIIRWITALIKGVLLFVGSKKRYPDILVLEMGADKPGDIIHLVSIARPHIAILTGIGNTHIEFFRSPQEVAKEKFKLITALHENGLLIYNADGNFLKQFMDQMRPEGTYRTITYGVSSQSAHVRASQIQAELLNLESEATVADSADHIGGIGFKVQRNETAQQAYLANVVGKAPVYAALAALAVADELYVDPEAAVDALKNIKPAPGRMRLIKGIKNTVLIDDTYNSSLEAAALSLETLVDLGTTGERWAVLGEMRELGDQSASLHRQLGMRVQEVQVDKLIAVGIPAKAIADGAKEAGMNEEDIFSYDTAEVAGRFLQSRMKEGDVVLIKASRGAQLEVVTKEVMAEPRRAKELLVDH